MPLYQLGVCYSAGSVPPDAATLEVIMRDVSAVGEEMQVASVWIFSGGLSGPESATTVLEQDGEAVITDGPFVESKELIGGFAVLELPNLDAAIALCKPYAAILGGTLEIDVRGNDDVDRGQALPSRDHKVVSGKMSNPRIVLRISGERPERPALETRGEAHASVPAVRSQRRRFALCQRRGDAGGVRRHRCRQ